MGQPQPSSLLVSFQFLAKQSQTQAAGMRVCGSVHSTTSKVCSNLNLITGVSPRHRVQPLHPRFRSPDAVSEDQARVHRDGHRQVLRR